jgi:hypothetical protein
MFRHRRRPGGDRADEAVAEAARRAEEAAAERRRAEAQANSERRWLTRNLLAAGDTDQIAAMIERSLRGGNP